MTENNINNDNPINLHRKKGIAYILFPVELCISWINIFTVSLQKLQFCFHMLLSSITISILVLIHITCAYYFSY